MMIITMMMMMMMMICWSFLPLFAYGFHKEYPLFSTGVHDLG